MTTRVLVTGGAGYIGCVLVPALLQRGYVVHVIDNLMYSQTPFLDLCADSRFTFHRGDARDPKLISGLMAETDVVIPLACLTGAAACERDPWAARGVIVEALQLILAHRRPDQSLLYPNTNSGYGIGDPGALCTEESPLRPLSLYGRLKVEAEQLVLAAGGSIVFRLATVFGASPRMRLDLLVNDFVYRALRDRFIVLYQAGAKRNYIHIGDVARAFLYGIEHWDQMRDQIYNLGLSDANLSKRELCELIKTHIPDFYYTEAEVGEDPDKRDYLVSNDKISATGFRPTFSLDDGIRELQMAYRIASPMRSAFTNQA